MKETRNYTMGARAEQAAATRDRIARAAAALFLEQRFEDVTLSAIAKASGVSHQTVLNHFESKEGVVGGVVELLRAERAVARSAEPGDIEGAVRALVGDYEEMGDANVRWAASELEVLREPLDVARSTHRQWLVAMAGDALPRRNPHRRRTLDALHAATDAYTWKLLRRDLRRSRTETEKTMVDLVVGILRGER